MFVSALASQNSYSARQSVSLIKAATPPATPPATPSATPPDKQWIRKSFNEILHDWGYGEVDACLKAEVNNIIQRKHKKGILQQTR